MKGNTVEKKHTLGKQQVAMQDPNRTFHDAGKAERTSMMLAKRKATRSRAGLSKGVTNLRKFA